MRGWSLSIGTIFGVELRLHLVFLLLLAFTIPYATFVGVNGGRGIALWLLLLLAVAVREIARALAAAGLALGLQSILLLPTGGLHTYTSSDAVSGAQARHNERVLGLAGPLANVCFGLMMAGLILTFAPTADLRDLRWITPAFLLRSLVWTNLMLAGLHCIPAFPLDAGRLLRMELDRRELGPASRPAQMAATVGPSFAVGMILGGMASVSLWMMMVGISLYLSHRLEQQAFLLSADTGLPGALPGALPSEGQATAVTMRDVMLTDYTMLSASSTLEDAMQHAGHTLQDVYPVVRGGNLVGAVSRQNIVESLQSNGNGYIQGVMTRGFQTASPTDSLVPTLRRIMAVLANQRAQLVPILDGERVVGIITPQNLQRSMTMLHQTRRMKLATRLRDED